jgi:arylsulfatase B
MKYSKKIKTTGNTARDVYRAMVYKPDEGVGKVVKALTMSQEWKNTLLVFTTDNGGAVGKGGNNHPLPGTKVILFDGGTKSVAFVAGKEYYNLK